MKKVVISLGGSAIVPDRVNYKFLEKFRDVIKKVSRKNKIVIVTGGGHTARKYINALRHEKLSEKVYSWVGIATTKLNARLVAGMFEKIRKIPDSLKEVKDGLRKSNLVVCGALGFHPKMTSDGTCVQIADYIKADLFINITDVKGLYDKDPKKHKNAKFVDQISFEDFFKIANKIKYKAGQHFVLDQSAAKQLKKSKIKTVIVSDNLKNLERLLFGKNFAGTIIC